MAAEWSVCEKWWRFRGIGWWICIHRGPLLNDKVKEINMNLAAALAVASKQYSSIIGMKKSKADLKVKNFGADNIFETIVKDWSLNKIEEDK